jgi:peptide/nickel transport system permease protein
VTVWASNLLADAIRDVSGENGRALLDDRVIRRRETAAVGGTR